MSEPTAKSESLWFVGRRQVEVRQAYLPALRAGQARVRVIHSAISAGTELLAYRGEVATQWPIDANLGALQGTFSYPFRYGYACVGVIEAVSEEASQTLVCGQRVFAFHPHTSRFDAPAADLLPLPAALSNDAALFLPNMETAITMVLDAAPLLGERIAVLGQGIVGRLVSGLLQMFPLAELRVVDPRSERLHWAQGQGIACGWAHDDSRFDAIVEASGSPNALQEAIDRCAIEGRVIVGSWYGNKAVHLNLGQTFHRQRVRLISSQVSTLPGTLSQAWSRGRRWDLALAMLQRDTFRHSIAPWITQRLSLAQAAKAYEALADGREGWEQVAFVYE